MLREPPPALAAWQQGFAGYLRDPRRGTVATGLPRDRAALYGELLFNNLCGFVDRCFPVCREVLGDVRWRRLLRRFYREAPLSSPYFREIPGAFLGWLERRAAASPALPRWLRQLAHYEWAELAVDVQETPPLPPLDGAADWFQGRVVVNPAMIVRIYDWPVHRIHADWRPRKACPTALAVYRLADDEEKSVGFAELSPAAARLLQALQGQARTLDEALAVCGLVGDPRLREHARGLLEGLRGQGLVLGLSSA